MLPRRWSTHKIVDVRREKVGSERESHVGLGLCGCIGFLKPISIKVSFFSIKTKLIK